ncbi:Calpain [Fasciola gigantica]|uniref:Calpain n=1 Tax=Fasciola gigantica TaxID=46835 RepID=A0A504Z1F1_FASGI|nr:Calpain [Fasciola gigantica]
MRSIQIIHSPDGSSGSVRRSNTNAGEDGGKAGHVISFSGTPSSYRRLLEPGSERKRLEVDPDIPLSLTPQGYVKMKMKMSLYNVHYDQLRRDLLRQRKLWSDPNFPASKVSLGKLKPIREKIDWIRIKEINPQARFFVDGATRFDIVQGRLGDCWLLAAISSICQYPVLLHQVVPRDQDPQTPDYVGIFRARFWHFGHWVEVLVDDRLPVYRGTKKLIFMQSKQPGEYWSALLEKAYAKLNGSYANLVGGLLPDAMEDLTGGVVESIDLKDSCKPKDLLRVLQLYTGRCVLMGCHVDVQYKDETKHLIRCMSPWADGHEWKGPWSDGAPEWEHVSPKEKKDLQLNFKDDGEFWMSLDCFVETFTTMDACHLGLESLERDGTLNGKRVLKEALLVGSWQKNLTAGGCLNYRETFPINPQFTIDLDQPDLDDSLNLCHVIIGLMQKTIRQEAEEDYPAIGFVVYAVAGKQMGPLNRAFLLSHKPIKISHFSNRREVTEQLHIPPGHYVIIPSTYEPNHEGRFLLRIITVSSVQPTLLDTVTLPKQLPEEILRAMQLEDLLLTDEIQMKQKFDAICGPKKQAIHAYQLQEILKCTTLADNIPGFKTFSVECCRSMITALDINHSGVMEYSEFTELLERCKAWKHAFLEFSKHSNEFIPGTSFRECLAVAGYELSNLAFQPVAHRYIHPEEGVVFFEDFILSIIRLKTAFDTFDAQPKNLRQEAIFTREDVSI